MSQKNEVVENNSSNRPSDVLMSDWIQTVLKTLKTKPRLKAVLQTKLQLVEQERRLEISHQIKQALNLLDKAKTIPDFLRLLQEAGL